MIDQFVTIIVPANIAAPLRKVGEVLGIETDGMWISPLSATGAPPATHYISTGYIYPRFVAAIRNGDNLYDFVQERRAENGKAMPYTKTQVKNALASVDISEEPPQVALKRLGLAAVAEILI